MRNRKKKKMIKMVYQIVTCWRAHERTFETFINKYRYFLNVLSKFYNERSEVGTSQFFGPPALAEMVLWIGSVRPSVCPSVRPFFRLSGRSLGIVLLVFSKFWHDARNPYEVGHGRAEFSRKIFFFEYIKRVFWIYY